MTNLRTIATGLRFPEGPVAMPDGSVILVEVDSSEIARVSPDGKVERIANVGLGPNGAALGPDGKLYLTMNGGFEFHDIGGFRVPGNAAPNYAGGSIKRVDLSNGTVETLYTACGDLPLRGPNDLVFDAHGGIYFTDLGKGFPRTHDRTGIFYAKADGSHIEEIAFPLITPNGIGLSPCGKRVYVAETFTGRVWKWEIESPGKLKKDPESLLGHGGTLVAGLEDKGEFRLFDSLAVDSADNVCVATLIKGGITVMASDGSKVETVSIDDPFVTNICFGGPDLRTAFICASGKGELLAMDWPRPGAKLNYLNT